MRIIQLPEAQSIQAGDVFAININGADYQVPVSLLVTAMQALGAYLTEDDLPLPVTAGGTGAESAQDAREALGITPANIGAVATANVANNLTTTGAGKVLDARQGPALTELIAQSTASAAVALSMFTNINSHVDTSRFFRIRVGNVVYLSICLTGGITDGTKLFDINSSIAPRQQTITCTIFNSNGSLITNASVWLEANNTSKLTFYGTTLPTGAYFLNLSYVI